MNIFLRSGRVDERKTDLIQGRQSFEYLRVGSTEVFDEDYRAGKEMATYFIRLENFQDYSEVVTNSPVQFLAQMGGLIIVAYLIGLALVSLIN